MEDQTPPALPPFPPLHLSAAPGPAYVVSGESPLFYSLPNLCFRHRADSKAAWFPRWLCDFFLFLSDTSLCPTLAHNGSLPAPMDLPFVSCAPLMGMPSSDLDPGL